MSVGGEAQGGRSPQVEEARRVVGRADRLRLDDPRRCLQVNEGRLEVFARITRDGDTQSIHLASLEGGDLAFGMDGAADGVVIEAVPAEATVQLIDASMVTAAGEARRGMVPAIERWVRALGRAISPGAVPRSVQAVVAGATAAVEEGSVLNAAGLVWTACSADHGLWYLGSRPVGAGLPVPLTAGLWAEAHAPAEVTGFATEAPELDLQGALSALHTLTVGLLAERAVHMREVDVRRIAQRRRSDDATLGRATELLAAAARQARETPVQEPGEPPLMAAARMVGAAGGIAMRLPKGGAEALERADDPLELIADAAGCEFRTVTLEGRWWQQENEPLLVFREQDMTPLALLPAGTGRAELVDPQSGERRRLDTTVAAGLLDTAVMFYPALPGESVGLGGLLRLGVYGVGADLGVALSMLILVGAASIVTPMVVGAITGSVVQQAQAGQLSILIAALVIASIASVGFTFVQSVAVLRMEGRMDVRAQSAVWIRLLRLPASFFRRFTVGDLVMRALGIDAMRRLFTTSALSSLLSIATGVFSLGLMFYYNVLLAACAALLLALYGLVMAYFVRRAILKQAALLAQQGRTQALILQLLQAVTKLRVTGAEVRGFARWAAMYAHSRRLALDWQRNGTVVPIANALLIFAGLTTFVAVIAVQAGQFWGPDMTAFDWTAINGATLERVIPAPTFLAFFTAYGQLFAAVTAIVQVTMSLISVVPLRERLQPILEAQPESREDGEAPGELSGAIEVANVEFRYVPDMPLVLRGLSLRIEPGSFVALVGPSGAGKSSLIRLLLGFEEPEVGSIFYDGKDLSRLDRRAVRRQLGVVLQNGRLMTGSIFDNIVAGSALSEEDAWEAARMAGLDQDIEAMPMKMQTMVAEGASTLSGGQRQRLMIARAIVRHPRILIFDEATSALDNETQRTVSESLVGLNCTRIAIAHRLSTVIDADRIFVVDAGRVVESGSYDELMALDGVFAQLARRQIA